MVHTSAGEPVPAPPASPGEPDEAGTPAEDAALDQELARLEADDAERSAAAVAASSAASSRPHALPPAEASSSGLSGAPSWDHAQMPTPPVAQAAPPPPPPPTLPAFFQPGMLIFTSNLVVACVRSAHTLSRGFMCCL